MGRALLLLLALLAAPAASATLRVATYDVELSQKGSGQLLALLLKDPAAKPDPKLEGALAGHSGGAAGCPPSLRLRPRSARPGTRGLRRPPPERRPRLSPPLAEPVNAGEAYWPLISTATPCSWAGAMPMAGGGFRAMAAWRSCRAGRSTPPPPAASARCAGACCRRGPAPRRGGRPLAEPGGGRGAAPVLAQPLGRAGGARRRRPAAPARRRPRAPPLYDGEEAFERAPPVPRRAPPLGALSRRGSPHRRCRRHRAGARRRSSCSGISPSTLPTAPASATASRACSRPGR